VIPYVNGRMHGTGKDYYESGTLLTETPFVNGERHGIEKWYYESGSLKQEIPYEAGKRHGVIKTYDSASTDIVCLTLYDSGGDGNICRI
jgi:antitoxin component YwqK of YwqJK toxin-antitoxin module